MNLIKKTVQRLVWTYKTSCPFQIAEHKNIVVLFAPLGNVYGFFQTYKRHCFIHINNGLDEQMQRFVCAHELGHAVLHQKENTPFIQRHTFFSVDRLEREANKFAVELLMPDDVIKEYQTLPQAAAACGVPLEVAKLKVIV